MDGLGLILLLADRVVVPMAMLASWQIARPCSALFRLVLFLQAGLFGTFTALNFFHWFLFWELSLVPAFFLIRLWGGPRRARRRLSSSSTPWSAASRLLLAFLAISWLRANSISSSWRQWARGRHAWPKRSPAKLGWYELTAADGWHLVIFAGVPGLRGEGAARPVPQLAARRPTPRRRPGTTMLLTGVMSKMGVYGFLRILLPIFPEQMRVGVARRCCGWRWSRSSSRRSAALAQRDFKRMLAYSSINHLGYCLLAIFAAASSRAPTRFPADEKAAALNGVFLQMFNHGLTAATLFWLSGCWNSASGGRADWMISAACAKWRRSSAGSWASRFSPRWVCPA